MGEGWGLSSTWVTSLMFVPSASFSRGPEAMAHLRGLPIASPGGVLSPLSHAGPHLPPAHPAPDPVTPTNTFIHTGPHCSSSLQGNLASSRRSPLTPGLRSPVDAFCSAGTLSLLGFTSIPFCGLHDSNWNTHTHRAPRSPWNCPSTR